MNSNQTLDPNLADRAALMTLPGVGEAVANRIIAGRPYAKVEDLLRVPGIGPRSLARFKEELVFKPDDQPPYGSDTGPLEEELSEGPERSAYVPVGDARQKEFITRERALWLVLGGGIVSAVVAVVLSLAILAGINGTLSVERQASIRQLRVQAETMTTQLDAVSADLDSLRSRLQAVEGLSGRMSLLEDQAQALRDEMDAASAELGKVETTVSSLSDQVGTIKESVDTFDQFLQGIRSLLGQIFPEPAPEVTQ